MPDIKELLKIAESKQKKQFSRGNRPDTIVNNNPLETIELIKNHSSLNEHKEPVVQLIQNEYKSSHPSKENSIETILKNRNDSVTKAEQFRNNNESNSVTIPEQLRNDSVTKKTNEDFIKSKRNNTVSESVTNIVTIPEQFRNDSVTKRHVSLNELSGNKLNLILSIFSFCHEKASTETGSISKDVFVLKTGLDSEVIRTTANRLIKEGYIQRISSKRGVGGYSNYKLNHSIYNECINSLFRNNSVTKAEQYRNNSVTESVSQSVTTPSSKIVSNNINILTNYSSSQDVQNKQLENPNTQNQEIAPASNLGWFKNLDFSAIPFIKPLMINSSIRKLVEEKLDPDDVQMFILKFKNWLTTQHKINSPLAIFCDKLKEYALEGDSGVLAALSDDEIEADKQFALAIEKQRSELDLIAKAKMFKLEQEKELNFQAWLEASSEEEQKALYPENGFAKFGSEIYAKGLKAAYFEKLNG